MLEPSRSKWKIVASILHHVTTSPSASYHLACFWWQFFPPLGLESQGRKTHLDPLQSLLSSDHGRPRDEIVTWPSRLRQHVVHFPLPKRLRQKVHSSLRFSPQINKSFTTVSPRFSNYSKSPQKRITAPFAPILQLSFLMSAFPRISSRV